MSTTKITPTLPDLLRRAFARAGSGEYRDIPGKVIAYNAATQTADVQPLVLVPDDGELRPITPVQGIQVRWPAGSTWSIVGELLPGDFGWIVPAGADIAAWRQLGTEHSPTATTRKGDFSDARFEPGSQPVSTPLASDAYAAGSLVIKAANLLLGTSAATDFVALASLVEAQLSAIETNLTALGSHTHAAGALLDSTAMPYTGVTAPGPATSYSAGSVAATKVKAI